MKMLEAQNNNRNNRDMHGMRKALNRLLMNIQIQLSSILYKSKQMRKDHKTHKQNNRALKFKKFLGLIEEEYRANTAAFMQRHLSKKAKIKARSITITVSVALFFAPAVSFAVDNILTASDNKNQDITVIVLMLLAILIIVSFLTFELVLLKKSE